MNRTFDRYAGIVFLAVGTAFAVGSRSIASSAYGSNVGANIFPMFLGIFLALMSVRLIYETFRKQQQAEGRKKQELDYKRFGIIFAASVLYAYFLEDIGFIIATFIFLMIGFQTMQRGRIWVSLLIAACFSAGVYVVYVYGLDGNLPGFPAWLGLS